MSDERRQILEQAFDKYAEGEDTPVHEVVEDIQAKEGTDGGDQGDLETADAKASDTKVEKAAEPSEKETTQPKFLPSEEAKPGEKGEERTGAEEIGSETKEASTGNPAPVSWRGDAKSHWGELPTPVQQEVLRREQETSKVLRKTAEARKFEREFNEVVQPYMGFIQAENSTPMRAVDNMMRTAAALRLGSPQQKASLVAQIIQNFGVDIGMLDTAISGQVPQEGQQGAGLDPSLQQYLDQRLAPVNDLMTRVSESQERRQQQTDQAVQKELDDFLATGESTYFEDVKDVMADLLDVADRQGKTMTYQQAYNAAIAMNPDISAKIGQQKQSTIERAQQQKEEMSLARKKRASSSVTGVPVGGNGASQPTSRQEQLEAAWELHSGGTA